MAGTRWWDTVVGVWRDGSWRQARLVRVVARWYARRPRLTSWAFLAAGMVILLVAFGRDAGLTLRQHVTLAVITGAVAWLCTWIVFLEDADSDGAGPDDARS